MGKIKTIALDLYNQVQNKVISPALEDSFFLLCGFFKFTTKATIALFSILRHLGCILIRALKGKVGLTLLKALAVALMLILMFY